MHMLLAHSDIKFHHAPFSKEDSVMVESLTTASLSQNIFKGPSIGMSIIQSKYCNACIIYVAAIAAVNSEPKVDVLTISCCFEYHIIGAQHKKQFTCI